MNKTARVQIERINGEPEVYQNEKMKTPKTTFICDGYIDGEAAQNFIVQTFGKKSEMVVEGFDFIADIDINPFNKKTQYVVPKNLTPVQRSNPPPRSAPATSASASAPASAGASRPQAAESGGGAYAQKSAYTLAEYDALFRHATDSCIQLIPVPNGTCVDAESFTRLVSTYMIAAVQLGVKVQTPEEQKAAAEPAKPPVDMHMLTGILEAKGLMKRVDEANMEEATLVKLWAEAGESKTKFGILVNDALKALEASPLDNPGGSAGESDPDALPF